MSDKSRIMMMKNTMLRAKWRSTGKLEFHLKQQIINKTNYVRGIRTLTYHFISHNFVILLPKIIIYGRIICIKSDQ
jgi:hypothetical protein